MKKIPPFYLLVFLLFSRCAKNSSTPDSSINFCSAVINGQYWTAGCSDQFNNCISAHWDNNRKVFILSCQDNDLTEVDISLFDSVNQLQSGTYTLNGFQRNNCASYLDYQRSYTHYYNTDSAYTGTITIKFDSSLSPTGTQYIYQVSGTFSYRAIYDDDTTTVNVSNGKFSLSCTID
jgi:Family of unknown function (DUF6252)